MSQEQLEIMAYCVIWLFMWDDEIDSECSSMGNKFDEAQRYRQTTLDYVEMALGLGNSEEMVSPNILITSITDITASISASNEECRRQLFREIKLFVQATMIEQQQRLQDCLPELQDYLEWRMGTSAVGVLVVLHSILVQDSMENFPRVDMEELMLQTNMMISITNDILSLKKELAAGTPDSLIPILWQQKKDLQTAINEAYELLKQCRLRFDKAEWALLSHPGNLPHLSRNRYIQMCKTNCTGNLNWRWVKLSLLGWC